MEEKARLVDVDRLIQCFTGVNSARAWRSEDVVEEIEEHACEVEVRPAIIGSWIVSSEDIEHDWGVEHNSHISCSNCGWAPNEQSFFCPRCGCDMRMFAPSLAESKIIVRCSPDFYRQAKNSLQYKEEITKLPDCNTCGRGDCDKRPGLGEYVRINCFDWIPKETRNETNS